ncbi:MAG: hypothetical protein MRY32_09970 [Rickettsiales bacterium]|nr:hypothetical protein [Rickettsiales bacterium]
MAWKDALGLSSKQGKTICVLGYDSHILESLFLKALAERDDVAHLYYIPVDPQKNRELFSDAAKRNEHAIQFALDAKREHAGGNLDRVNHMYGYDLKEALTQDALSDGNTEAIDACIHDILHSKAKPARISTKSIDMMIAKRFGANDAINLEPLLPHSIYWLNDPRASQRYGVKSYLEKLSHDLPMVAECKNINSPIGAVRMMESFGDDSIVVKTAHSVASSGVGRIMRQEDGSHIVEAPKDFRSSNYTDECQKSEDGLLLFPLEQMRLPCGGALAMRTLDAKKGDIRAVLMNGEIIGGYKRMPKGWLCSGEYKDHRVPVDMKAELLPEDYAALQETAEHLRDERVNWVSVDLLEDKNGHRKISEFNTSYTIDFSNLEEHAAHADVMARDKRPSELAADAAMGALQAHQDKEIAFAQRYGRSSANLPAH